MHLNQNTLMPDSYFPDDEKWIQEMLLQLSLGARNRALVAYSAVYQEQWEAEPVSYRKDNTARREANKRLREYVRKFNRAMQGYTADPQKVAG
ncbi:hypothetical protein UA45_01430 [Morganella morganii]|uniref:Uncharacterized protein n=1 Tax=Morganella morganii TaxID=582 RepID=A0A0D8LDF7_MORMO|nr:hypothetical protein UA45_01430 [Morganella morganii]